MINTNSPCNSCPNDNTCPKYCDTWKSWFKITWRQIRETFSK